MVLEKTFKIVVSIGIIGIAACVPRVEAIPTPTASEWVDHIREYERQRNSTPPSDVLNSAIADLDVNYGSNGSAEQKKLLQLSCNGDSEGLRRRHDRCSYRFGL